MVFFIENGKGKTIYTPSPSHAELIIKALKLLSENELERFIERNDER